MIPAEETLSISRFLKGQLLCMMAHLTVVADEEDPARLRKVIRQLDKAADVALRKYRKADS